MAPGGRCGHVTVVSRAASTYTHRHAVHDYTEAAVCTDTRETKKREDEATSWLPHGFPRTRRPGQNEWRKQEREREREREKTGEGRSPS